MAWRWETYPLDGPTASDPWLEWRRRRQRLNVSHQILCERESGFDPVAMRNRGWRVPAVYDADAPFFTARCVAPGLCKLPERATGARDAPHVVDGSDQLFQHLTEMQPFGTAASSAVARRTPLIAVIDADIAILHRQFQNLNGTTRIRAHWDQGSDASNPRAPWRMPERLGYGRELRAADIDQVVSQGQRERAAYAALNLEVPAANWSHGTQVLALAAGNSAGVDSTAAAPIVTVSLPGAAFERTHGLWLNVYLLDALYYILEVAKPGEPVIVNVSLGGHSGPHDGTSLLERAIDALIAREGGRLTVVIAAGNSRRSSTHVHAVLPIGVAPNTARALDLSIDMANDEPMSSFVEVWCTGDASAEFVLTPPSYVAPPSPFIQPGRCACLLDEAGRVVAMAIASHPHSLSPPRIQALLAVASTRPMEAGAEDATARAGPWALHVEGGDGLNVDAWVARVDSTVYRRRTKAFGNAMRADLIRTEGTLSSICGARQPIIVGGYRLDGRGNATMYEDSAEGFGGAGRGRLGPDLCALAELAPGAAIGFLSDEPFALGWQVLGTSVAAPCAVRALAKIVHAAGSMPRDALLTALKARQPTLPVPRRGVARWTGDYWLPPCAEFRPTNATENA